MYLPSNISKSKPTKLPFSIIFSLSEVKTENTHKDLTLRNERIYVCYANVSPPTAFL